MEGSKVDAGADAVALAIRDLTEELCRVRIALALIASVEVENSALKIPAPEQSARCRRLEKLLAV